ncbi:ABC transporter ATP-binding protein [Sinorhizobium terangae]|uniref:ATP-binding cassette domain-containing protein n=1 Tax=Sinorhizobium terangae TaxID=110322 RepID=A0A6N7LI60_SINTE|nr:ABC transporter ATP-binding protein [Sinorhizobium terangae]MBB4185685.1 iron(III) transport system ATP-binding protein [Sinorhizobium terangae]MQX17551.1 ATP-binding cassette domain-containing protein [Sinorhizobium terangae]WFU46257.1 ABC transporter ATP-binding protein [Sinorhizobium terangae]
MAQLILNHVTKDFGGGRPAVADVSLTLRRQAFLALLGPSGCGKTTVLRMIAGFEQPTDGSISYGERRLSDAERALPPEKRNMAMVFQSYALWPHMTVAQNVGYPLKVRGISGAQWRKLVGEALSLVRLTDLAERRPAELSGGQRQRVALARCLVTQPDVVLLDEPLANLDQHLRKAMEETFRAFHERSGATMVYVTHDQAEAMALATDVAVMSEGRLLQVAPPAEIYARPEGRIVGGLIGRGSILRLPLAESGERQLGWPVLREALGSRGADGASGGLLADVPPADMLVRPEHVHRGTDGILMRVMSCVFEGERFALDLALGDGQRLKAFSSVAIAEGQTVPFVIASGWRL